MPFFAVGRECRTRSGTKARVYALDGEHSGKAIHGAVLTTALGWHSFVWGADDIGNAAAENDMEDTKDDQPPLALTDLLGRLSVMRLRARNCLRSAADTSGVRRALKDVGELCQVIELLEESRSRWVRAATTQFEMIQNPSNGDVGRAIAVVGRAGLYDQEKLGLHVTE